MKLTKNFRIKTPEGFTDIINFFSKSVYFEDGRNLDTRIQDEVDTVNERIDTEVNTLNNKIDTEVDTLNERIDTEVDTLEKADVAEEKARKDEITRVEGLITAEQEARVAADDVVTNSLNKEIQDRADAVSSEKNARENEITRVEGLIATERDTRAAANETLTTNLNTEIQDRINAINDEKTARENAINGINKTIGSIQYNGDSLTDGIKKAQDKGDDNFTIIAQNTNNISKNASDITQINEEITTIKKELNSTLNVLTTEQKDAIQEVMNMWSDNNAGYKHNFYYSGNIIMDKYAAGGELDFINSKELNNDGEPNPYYGKYELNCSTFVQFVMMGVTPDQLLATDYNGYVKPAFDFGYAFNFKERAIVFGLLKDSSSSIPKDRYYGFRNPLNDTTDWKGTFSKNTYYTPSNKNITVASQAFNPFAYANDMAKELYELGCEIPYSALDVGDIVFSTSLDTESNESIFDNIAWRNITHVFMVKDFVNGEPVYIECTDQGADFAPIATSCFGWKDAGLDSSRLQASALTRKIVMCARNPAAFGITNFPQYEGDTKTAIELTKIPNGVER